MLHCRKTLVNGRSRKNWHVIERNDCDWSLLVCVEVTAAGRTGRLLRFVVFRTNTNIFPVANAAGAAHTLKYFILLFTFALHGEDILLIIVIKFKQGNLWKRANKQVTWGTAGTRDITKNPVMTSERSQKGDALASRGGNAPWATDSSKAAWWTF